MIYPTSLIIGSGTNLLSQVLDSLNQQRTPNNPDIFVVDDYTIDKIREIQNFLSKKPYSHNNKVVIIEQIHKLQNEAQNALLKMLEEPGDNNYFILTSNQPGKINSTILSRCHQIRENTTPQSFKPKIIFGQKITDALAQSESLITDKSEFLQFLQNEQQAHHQLFIQEPSLEAKLKLEKINTGIAMFHANIDPKSILDFILLK